LRQKLNDAGSSATKIALGEVEAGKQAFSMAENILEALVRGEISVRGTGKSMTLEDKITQSVIREIFKAVCKRPVAQEIDQSNEALLSAIGKVKGDKTPDEVLTILRPRIDAKIALEKAKPQLPEVDFEV
jgi:predicted ATP-binding protein involved in virulence